MFVASIPVFDHERAYGSGDDVRAAHVTDTELKLVLGVASTDDRQTTEDDGVSALLGASQLGEDETGHERLDEHAETRLQHEHQERRHTLRLYHAQPVTQRQ